MRNMAGVIRRSLFILAALVFTGFGITAFRETGPLLENISLSDRKTGGVPIDWITEIRELERSKENGFEFTAWNEFTGMWITDGEGYRNVETSVIEISGSSELLIPGGTVLHSGDREGCLIGEELAEQLFGSRHAQGLSLYCGGRKLVVRGVIEKPGRLLLVQAVDEKTVFDRITLKKQDHIMRRAAGERFTSQHGLDMQMIRFDIFSGERLLELIPGKWSDFPGWRQNVKRMGQDAVLLFTVEKSSVDIIYMEAAVRAGMLFTAGFFFWYLGLKK